MFFLILSAEVVHAQVPACGSSPLSRCTNEELISLLSKDLSDIEGKHLDQVKKIADELISRKAVSDIYRYFINALELVEVSWGYEILDQLRSPKVDTLLNPLANRELSYQAYFANLYFASVGREFALANLNANYFQYSISSYAWAETVRLFGKYKYYPARHNILSSIGALV